MAIVGVGLIGGSIGLALRARGLASQVVGIGRDLGRLEAARENGAIDRGTTDFSEGVAGADVVVVCTPVSQVAHDVRKAAEMVPASVLLTDAGSTKRQIVETVQRHPQADSLFIGRIRWPGRNAPARLMLGPISFKTGSVCSRRRRSPPRIGSTGHAGSGAGWDAG